ncbi:MAG: restriction endonuclease subunit S [Gemmatimonadetes bacterium]|nr:restriction endonuclease subunit S [Gemmatimonadota bacterium]
MLSDKVPKGYKRTEVGVIPSDWSMYSIGDLFDYLRTASNSRAELGDTGDVAYVHYGDIHTRFHHFIDFSRDKLPRLSVDKGVTANRLREGDLIVADASEDETGVGKSVEVRNLGVTEAVAGLHTLLLRPKDLRTHEGYRGYLLDKESVKRQLRSLATGLKVFGISKQALREVRIPLPSPTEQRTIAEALSDVDGLLTALEELIDKKQAVKQATTQQLLTGKFRLPGFSGKWETKRLGDIASIRNQKVLPSKVPIDTPCVELDHIGQREGRLLGCSTAQYSTSSKYRFYSGDVLFGRLRSYLRKFWLADRDGICTTEIWPLVTDTKQADNGFLYTIIQSDQFIKAASVSYGTHMPRTDWDVMRNFEIWLPPVREQRAIAGTLSDMDIEIAVLERHRDKTRAIKQGMMQQLLTGRVRLVKPASPSK